MTDTCIHCGKLIAFDEDAEVFRAEDDDVFAICPDNGLDGHDA